MAFIAEDGIIYGTNEASKVITGEGLSVEDTLSNVKTELNNKTTEGDVERIISNIPTEDWVFTLEDGRTITKRVLLK